jgi:hypothetical protein
MKDLLDNYFALQEQIYNYFGYKEDWVVIPIENATEYYWKVDDNKVEFAEKLEDFAEGDGYSNEIYTQRFLPKWVYRGKDYTMIVVDTHTDGNKFLQIFDNSKEQL